MIHRAPETVPPLFARPPDPPENDAAPLAGGAGVNRSDDAHNLTHLPLSPPAHRNAPDGTSEVAADRIAGCAAQQRAQVLAVIDKAGVHGATDAEIETATGIRAQSVSARRGELRTLGLVVDSGQRRRTPRGRPAAVWVTPRHAPKTEGGAA